MVTWAFVLEAQEPGATRLIVRARGGQNYRFHGLPNWLGARAIEVVHFIMERKQLLGIAQRAEAMPATEAVTRREGVGHLDN
jgi:hypothetical protein